MKHTWLGLGMLIACLTSTTQAHIVFAEPKAAAGSHYKGSLRVGHGCGVDATTALTVQMPAGFRGTKPQPKHGWRVSIRKAALATPYDSHGRTVKEEVVELLWEAQSSEFHLLNEHFDEFSFTTQLPAVPGAAWFKIIQTCSQGANEWVQIPASGLSTQGLKSPAALLQISASDHHHHE
jgi:uncharacterized protein YcnI